MNSACLRYGQSPDIMFTTDDLEKKVKTLSITSSEGKVTKTYFCTIAKVSSCTWSSIIKSVRKGFAKSSLVMGVVRTQVEDGEMNASYTFVRDPYSRLLSAYVSKLLFPNNMYWDWIGRYTAAQIRPNATQHSIQCGHDITFPEIIKFFIDMHKPNGRRDAHFNPIHEQCGLCNFPYQFIGHLETFREDAAFIIKAMGSSFVYPNADFGDSAIKNYIKNLFNWSPRILKCIDMNQALRRAWVVLQIRGLIGKTQGFPLTKERALNITQDEMTTIALAARTNSGDPNLLKAQKKEALTEAFGSVPLADRLMVKKLVYPEFDMFGYDPEPEEVFPNRPYTPDPDFSYFDWSR